MKKTVFKRLSLLLTLAMIVGLLTGAATVTAEAASDGLYLRGFKTRYTMNNYFQAWIGGISRNVDYSIGDVTSGIKGTWTIDKTSIATVNASSGVITPKKNGDCVVTFTTKDGKKFSTNVHVRTRAASVYLAETANGEEIESITLKEGESKDLYIVMPISANSKKKGGTSATYFSYVSSSDKSVAAASKTTASVRKITIKGEKEGNAVITVKANQTTEKNVEKKYGVKCSISVTVESEGIKASQTGDREVTVTGKELPSDKSLYSVKSMYTTFDVTNVTVNSARTSAVLTLAKNLQDDTMTVSVGTQSAQFTGKAAKINASQTTDTTITVTGENLPTDKAAYDLKHNGVPVAISTVSVNSAKTSAVLTTALLSGGSYTVTVDEKTAEFNCKEPAMQARQTGVKTIMVSSTNLPTAPSAYVVKRNGNINVSIQNVKVSGNEATITTTMNLMAGSYTVTVNGKELPAFVAEASTPTTIEITSPYLIFDAGSTTSGTIGYKVLNQFGEDVTAATAGLTAVVTPFSSTSNFTPSNGIIHVTNILPTYVAGSNVSGQVIVFSTTQAGLRAESSLSIAAAAAPATYEVFGIYSIVTKKPTSIAVNSAAENANARLLVRVKDQYGNDMRSIVAGKDTSMTLASVTGLNVDNNKTYTETMVVDGVTYVAVPFTGTATVKAGSVQIIFVSLTRGGQYTYNFEVENTKSVANFTVYSNNNVYAGETTEFSYVATNANGGVITDYATLSNPTYGVPVSAPWSWVQKSDGTAGLRYNANLDTTVTGASWGVGLSSVTVYHSFVLPSNYQVSQVSFSVNAPSLPTSININNPNGMTTGTTPDALSSVKIYDQYGRQMNSFTGAASEYYIGFTQQRGSASIAEVFGGFTGSTIKTAKLSTLSSSATFVKFAATSTVPSSYETADYLVALYRDSAGTQIVAGSEASMTVTCANANSLSGYSVSLPSTMYTGNTTSVTPIVTGTAPNGTKVAIEGYAISELTTYGIVSGTQINAAAAASKIGSSGSATATVRVVYNPSGAGLYDDVNITLTNALPKVDSVTVNTRSIKASDINGSTVNAIMNTLTLNDQYSNSTFGITANQAALKGTLVAIQLSGSAIMKTGVTISGNNTAAVTINGLTAGDTVTALIQFASGKTETVNYTIIN